MDILLALKTNVVSVVMAVLALILLWKIRGKQSSFERLPPGPAPNPLLGNLFQFNIKEAYKYYLELSNKYGSVVTIWLANTPVVIISGYQALKDTMIGLGEEFSGRAIYPLLMKSTYGYGVLSTSGYRWKEMRRFTLMTLKNFGMGRRSIEERVREEAENLVEMFKKCEGSAFSPVDMLFNAVNNVICSIVFGNRFELEDPQFKSLLRTVNTYFTILSSPLGQIYNVFPRLVSLFPGKHHQLFKDLEEAREYCKHEAQARMNTLDPSCPQDFIEAFVLKMKEEKDNPDTEYHFGNLVSIVWNMFSAGTETTSSTVRYAVLLMMKHPDVQERVQREIDEVVGQDRWPSVEDRQNLPYTDAVIHEIQRYMDLAPIAIPHKMMCDTEYNGYIIPKGVMVFPLLSSVLIDPKLWKNPNCFDPENFLDSVGRFQKNDAFVVFGMGKRACLGEALARIELFIFFTSLLQHFTFKATVPPEELDTTPKNCSFGRMPRTYECYAIPRK
ncbi:cytochrome P450 2M1-like [Sinocyclocheilus rhinocerous]|uniref:Cytochrome P450 2M1-like n=1 Tax=Sinocyclocheilus rhinocerous TaxID=307959 RepID=A0A673J1Z1_9TELE|nr:PREDICTED: cytochrome P450 2M1-like [Sinocyclocheilus rhinocerous]XP_016429434.1 PREDICTED: cytochrome P450 2M1-like [Sinocyclocheilus rhinocerous]